MALRRGRLDHLRVATLQEVAEYGGTLPKGLLPPIAGGAETYLGRVGSSTSAGTTPVVINCGLALPAGSLVIVSGMAHAAVSPSRLITNVSDSGSNAWQHDIATSATSDSHPLDVWSSLLTTALTPASTFTLTVASGDDPSLVVDAFSGVVGQPYRDVAAEQAAGGTSNSITPTRSGDLLYAVLGERGTTSQAPTVSAGWTATGNVHNETGSSLVFPAYQLGVGTGAFTATFSATSGTAVVAIVAYGGGGASGFFAFM